MASYDKALPFSFEGVYEGPLYTESHRALAARVREFCLAELEPHVDEWEDQGGFPKSLHRTMANTGLYQLQYPAEYGGGGVLDVVSGIVFTMEMCRPGSGGLAASLLCMGIGLPPVLKLGSDEMKRRVAPAVLSGEKVICLCISEPWAGSDVAGIRTTAVRDGNYYVVNGVKMFITGGCRADYYTVAVRTGGQGAAGISLLLIDRAESPDGFRVEGPLAKMGWQASDTARLVFEDVRVPAKNLIGKEGQGFLGIMLNFNSERLMMSVQATAYARVCLLEAIAYARERVTFGKPLVKIQVIRHKLMEMARQVQSSQAMLEGLAVKIEQGGGDLAALAVDICLLKVQSTRAFEVCAREALQVFGGKGFLRGGRAAKVERLYREGQWAPESRDPGVTAS
eukprot:gene1973-2996_t